MSLPDCDEVWRRYFRPWLDEHASHRGPYSATRPDAELAFSPGTAAEDVVELPAVALQDVRTQLERMLAAAREDWPTYLAISPPVDIGWIAAFDAHWTRRRVHDLLNHSDPDDYGNDVVVLACELGTVLGEVVRVELPQLQWLYSWPYWNSRLLDVPSGYVVNVFDWAVKRFSEYGVEDGYEGKVRATLDLIRSGW